MIKLGSSGDHVVQAFPSFLDISYFVYYFFDIPQVVGSRDSPNGEHLKVLSRVCSIWSQARFFDHNPRARALITGLIPTLLVAGLGILIPVILFVIGRKAQTEVTFSGLHNGRFQLGWRVIN